MILIRPAAGGLLLLLPSSRQHDDEARAAVRWSLDMGRPVVPLRDLPDEGKAEPPKASPPIPRTLSISWSRVSMRPALSARASNMSN